MFVAVAPRVRNENTPNQHFADSGCKYEWEAAKRVSQRLAHSSTCRNAGGLNFRVRDGYGCRPAAVAALTPTRGIEPRWSSNAGSPMFRPYERAIQFAPGPDVMESLRVVRCGDECVARPVSTRGLNASLPWRVHPEPIELVFYEWSQWYLFFRWVSSLDAFSSYPVMRDCSARALSDDRYISGIQS